MLDKKNSRGKSQRGWAALTWLIVISILLSACGSAKPKVYHIGILSGLSVFSPAVDGFKSEMTTLGYVEGKNITYDVQSSDFDIPTYKAAIKKFMDEKVDLIFTFPTEAAMEAKTATQGTDIPVVFTLAFTDVKGIDLINSIREPGGNITGVRFPSVEIASKRLQILLEMVPTAKRIFVPYGKDYPNALIQLDVIRPQAKAQGVELIEFGAASPQDLQAKLDGFISPDGIGIDAVLMIAEPLGVTPGLAKFCYDHKIPIGGGITTLEYGSMFALLPQPSVAGQQAARLADKILRGTPAGTIPVVSSDSYFQINYKTAQALGVTVPDGLLKQADQIIK
jgi:putative ABC transport system substrate-binding protein